MAVRTGRTNNCCSSIKTAIDHTCRRATSGLLYERILGGRSEIKPSEISPQVYQQWWAEQMKS